jgi:hypothetical protein
MLIHGGGAEAGFSDLPGQSRPGRRQFLIGQNQKFASRSPQIQIPLLPPFLCVSKDFNAEEGCFETECYLRSQLQDCRTQPRMLMQ